MGDIRILLERKVKAKGLIKAFPEEAKLKKFFFPDDFEQLKNVEARKVSLPAEATLFYPGCGADMLFPLFCTEKLCLLPKKMQLLFIDKEKSLGLLKTVLDDVGISFALTAQGIAFYWKNTLVELIFVQGNVFEKMSEIPAFDVYFERAFRIFKEQEPYYEKKVFEKLNLGGVLISDSGFSWLSASELQRIAVPKKLSSYEEMVVGVKI